MGGIRTGRADRFSLGLTSRRPVCVNERDLNKLDAFACIIEDKNPLVIAVGIGRRQKKALAILRIGKGVSDNHLAIIELDLQLATGTAYFVGIIVLVSLVAFKVLGEKNGFEVFHFDAMRIAINGLQMKKKLIRKEIVGVPLDYAVVIKPRDDFASNHCCNILSAG
jgi:hypothetical protein